MSAGSQFTAKWRKLVNFSTSFTAIGRDQEKRDDAPTAEGPHATSQLPKEPIDNAVTSTLLRLPAELRNQIYTYLDLSECIIEVISLSKTQFNALDENGVVVRHNPYPNEQTWYRLEQAADEDFSLDNPNIDTRRKRCVSVQGLFALTRVCRQLRTETMLLHFEGPSFAFSDRRFNYAKAFPAFVQSLSQRERVAIRSIHWPLRQAREFNHRSQTRKPMEPPDKEFVKEFRKLPYLSRVVLRYVATDVGAERLTRDDNAELRVLIEDVAEGERYRVEQIFRRELAIRGMRRQLSAKEHVVVECDRTKRVAF